MSATAKKIPQACAEVIDRMSLDQAKRYTDDRLSELERRLNGEIRSLLERNASLERRFGELRYILNAIAMGLPDDDSRKRHMISLVASYGKAVGDV